METVPLTHVLFVCSRNKWRSPTAEKIWSKVPGICARSAGTNTSASRRLTVSDIQWADLICTMEEKHKSRILKEFRAELGNRRVHVLDVPDDYSYMDPELIEILWDITQPLIEPLQN